MKKNGKQKEEAQAQAQAQAQEQAQQRQEDQQYIEALTSGEIPPPSSIVAYLVEELKNNNAEVRAVSQTLRQAQKVGEQAEQRMIELRGIGRKYVEDILARKEDKEDSPEIIVPGRSPQAIVR